MWIAAGKEPDIAANPVLKWLRGHLTISDRFDGEKLTTLVNGVKHYTPFFVVLIMIGVTDLIFAVDSIPAIFSVTKDPYIVFFSNIFAIIGLRSMFFLLAGVIDKFRFLKVGLAILLTFIGLKMLFHEYLDRLGFSTTDSLFIIVGILGGSIFLSLVLPEQKKDRKLKYNPKNDDHLRK